MLKNIPLKAHDDVALVCTGSICLQADHPEKARDFLKKNYQLNAYFKEETTQPLPAQKRAEIFLNYLFDSDIKWIAAMRGGEGTADILPYVHQHYERIKKLAPKPISGFSDITALLVYFEKYYHWPVIHGSTPLQFALQKVSKKSESLTMDLLFGHLKEQGLPSLTPLNQTASTPGIIEATLTGGCLSLIDISIKDLWEIETDNKIIFFEDVSEKGHKIIRSLKYFSRIGLFKSAKAIILGDFNGEPVGCTLDEQEKNRVSIQFALDYFASQQSIPVLQTSDVGHGKVNYPLMYSTVYQLQLGEKPSLFV